MIMSKVRRLIDIGVNLTDPVYQGIYNGSTKHVTDIDNVIERARSVGVEKLIVTAGTLSDVKSSLELVRKYSFLYTTVGCHPTRCNEFINNESGDDGDENYLNNLINLANDNKEKIIAVGEFGLDYDRLQFCEKQVQLKYFEKQLEIAEKTKLPLFLHCRNAANDLLRILTENRERFSSGVVHSFDGTLEEAKSFIDIGLYIGINGCSMKTTENLDVIKQLPVERLLIETDAPWCDIRPTHASFKYVDTKFVSRKKEKHQLDEQLVKGRNEPCTLVQVLEVIANLREQSVDELSSIIYDNTEKLFFH